MYLLTLLGNSHLRKFTFKTFWKGQQATVNMEEISLLSHFIGLCRLFHRHLNHSIEFESFHFFSKRTIVAMCLVNSDDFAKFHLTFPRILNRTLHMQSCSTRFLSIISLFSSFRTTSYNAFQWYQM